VRPVPGLSADLYYLGLDRRNAAFDSGVAHQTVHSVGTRLWGQAGAWDYNTEGGIDTLTIGPQEARPLRTQFMRPQLSHRSKSYALRSGTVDASDA
jgi:hypothetical protein